MHFHGLRRYANSCSHAMSATSHNYLYRQLRRAGLLGRVYLTYVYVQARTHYQTLFRNYWLAAMNSSSISSDNSRTSDESQMLIHLSHT